MCVMTVAGHLAGRYNEGARFDTLLVVYVLGIEKYRYSKTCSLTKKSVGTRWSERLLWQLEYRK